MVGANWLKQFVVNFHIFKADKPMIARGIVGKLRFDNRARFDIYLKSVSKVLIQVAIEAWVHDHDLKPNLLLGNDFCAMDGVVVSYPRRVVTLASCKDLQVPMQYREH